MHDLARTSIESSAHRGPPFRRKRVARVALLIVLAVGDAAAQTGEWLVKVRGPLDAAAVARLERETGAVALEVVPQLGLVRMTLRGRGGGDGAAVQERLASHPRVEHVTLEGQGRGGGFIPDDPQLPLQWHLHNAGQTSGTPGADIGAFEAWAVTRGSDAVTVAVLDTGIDFEHPELEGRLLPGYDFVNEDADPSADNPHGVQVAGFLAANADNGTEVAGVDHRARVLPVKVLDDHNFGSTFDLIQGILYAADEGADVISMSLINYPDAPSLEDALVYAREHGAVLVACAGNGGVTNADYSWPGASPQVLSIGWTDSDDQRGKTTNLESATGAALDLVAPGELVTTVKTSVTQFFSGCSAATPIVAGVVSLLLSLDPALTHDDIRDLLIASAADEVGPPDEDTPGRDDFFGWGRVDAAAAVALVPEPHAIAAAAAAILALALARRPRC